MKSCAQNIKDSTVTPTNVVDGAVGVEETYWYVAIVNNNSERSVARKLMDVKMGGAYECYVPTQIETRIWKNGRKKKIERVLLPAMIFVRCTEKKRLETKFFGYIKNYMVDYTKGTKGHYSVATIPNQQIEVLKDMLQRASSPVSIENVKYHIGDYVKVISGSLKGLEGNVISEPTGLFLIIAIDSLGYAKVQISQSEVKKIK